MKKILLNTLTSFRASLRNSTTYASSPRGLLLIPLILVCFALSPQMQALSPPPDGGYPNGNTAEGDSALSGLTGGFYNSAVGFLSLLSNGDANFNTGVGAGVLLLNTANENTAVGAGALFSNTTGSNTAVGSFAMFNNTTGGANTAIGFHTLLNNVDGNNNVALGVRPMELNTSGGNNTAIGNLALSNNQTTSDHVCVGRFAGSGITTANNNVIVGHHSGVHSVFGQISDRCHIDNIFGAPVSAGTAAFVFVDSDGRLGTTTATGADPGGFFTQPSQRIAPQSAKPDTAFNSKVETLQTTVAQQEKQIKILTAQLKEQAAQIQKVSAQLEVKKPAAQVVSYDR
jgi:hypothetical protein